MKSPEICCAVNPSSEIPLIFQRADAFLAGLFLGSRPLPGGWWQRPNQLMSMFGFVENNLRNRGFIQELHKQAIWVFTTCAP